MNAHLGHSKHCKHVIVLALGQHRAIFPGTPNTRHTQLRQPNFAPHSSMSARQSCRHLLTPIASELYDPGSGPSRQKKKPSAQSHVESSTRTSTHTHTHTRTRTRTHARWLSIQACSTHACVLCVRACWQTILLQQHVHVGTIVMLILRANWGALVLALWPMFKAVLPLYCKASCVIARSFVGVLVWVEALINLSVHHYCWDNSFPIDFNCACAPLLLCERASVFPSQQAEEHICLHSNCNSFKHLFYSNVSIFTSFLRPGQTC